MEGVKIITCNERKCMTGGNCSQDLDSGTILDDTFFSQSNHKTQVI
jgi:hypothetical protein